MSKEITIYATLYSSNLELIESALKQGLNPRQFSIIEQKTVLIYEDSVNEFSIEPNNASYYLSGRIKEELKIGESTIIKIADKFIEMDLTFSLDYQEEDNCGETTSDKYNISNKIEMS